MNGSGNNHGLALLEVLLAVSILALVGASFLSVYLTGERLVRQGLSVAKIQAIARIGMEKMERALRMSTSATVLGSGDQLQFVFDPDANPTTNNSVTRFLTFATGDGSEATADDNTLTYDPDAAVAGDEEVIMANVRRIPGSNIFGVSGKVVSVNLRVFDVIASYQSPQYSGSDVEITTDIYLRN